MSRYISDTFKEAIRISRFDYEKFAKEVGLSSKQALSYVLNNRKDSNWRYEDVKLYCGVLNISHTKLLEDVDRNKRLAEGNN